MKPSLVILAAGIGSRYGGFKQIDPVGPNGELLLDYAVYDAQKAGFAKVCFVITRELKEGFDAFVNSRYRNNRISIAYAFQDMDKIPAGFTVPPERKKPWGTGHAVLVAQEAIQEPFAVINADDYYGSGSFMVLGKALKAMRSDSKEFVMVGFDLEKTLSEHGYVARGVCTVKNGDLVSIIEREKIRRVDNEIIFESPTGEKTTLDPNTQVSMNCWGFSPRTFFPMAEAGFSDFLTKRSSELKAEFYLPSIVNSGLETKSISVKVLNSGEQWFGMTYPQDRAVVKACIQERIEKGSYPARLFQ